MPSGRDTYGGFYSVLTGRDIAQINNILENTDVYFDLEPKYKKLVTPPGANIQDFRGLPKSVLLYLLELVYNVDRGTVGRYPSQSIRQSRGEEELYPLNPDMLGKYQRDILILGRAIQRLKVDQQKIGWPSYRGNPYD